VRVAEAIVGRRLLVVLDPGEDVVLGIVDACRAAGVVRGLVPVFVGAFTEVELIGTHEHVADPDAPLPRSVVARWTEGTGSATIAPGGDGEPVLHLHAAVGEKLAGAAAVAGHVLRATTHYTLEVVIEELLEPTVFRAVPPGSYPIPTLAW
jgi:predicted DNA-binding protein with PD1-like motif